MTAWRLAELHQVLYFIRQARAALVYRDLSKAHRWEQLATRGLYLVRGIACAPGGTPTATAGLARILLNLSDDIEAALRPVPESDPVDLLELLAEGVRVLRLRDGFDIDEEAVFERARNQLTAILAGHEVRERPRPIHRQSTAHVAERIG